MPSRRSFASLVSVVVLPCTSVTAAALLLACGADSDLFGEPAPAAGVGGAAAGPGATGTGGAVTTTSFDVASTTGSGSASSVAASSVAASSVAASSVAASSVAASSVAASSVAASSVAASSVAASSVAASSSSGGNLGPCGNGKLDGGEVCDDLGVVGGDGCSPTCQLEGSPNQCPSGVTFVLTNSVLVQNSTKNVADVTETSCGGKSAGDHVYAVKPTKTGLVGVALSAANGFNAILAVRSNCDTKGNTFACLNSGGIQSFFYSAQANVPFYVVVTGSQGSEGSYVLSISPPN